MDPSFSCPDTIDMVFALSFVHSVVAVIESTVMRPLSTLATLDATVTTPVAVSDHAHESVAGFERVEIWDSESDHAHESAEVRVYGWPSVLVAVSDHAQVSVAVRPALLTPVAVSDHAHASAADFDRADVLASESVHVHVSADVRV